MEKQERSTIHQNGIDLNVHEGNSPSECLGISNERRDELCEAIENNFGKSEPWNDMKAVAKECKTHEELAFAMLAFGAHASEGGDTPIASLAEALKKAGILN